MAEHPKIPAARPAARRHRPLGAALATLWYLLVYTHLASYALTGVGLGRPSQACCCAADTRGGAPCCSKARTGHDANCTLPDEDLGCRGPRPNMATSCMFAAPCGGELPAAPQTAALTWPHLAATTLALQPHLGSLGLGLPEVAPCFSLLPAPPDKVPKQ
jgi:hypothetical protein